MGLTQVQNIMMGILLGMVVVVSGLFVFGYYVNLDPTLATSNVNSLGTNLNKTAEITTSIEDMQASLEAASNKGSALGWLDVLIGSSYRGLQALMDSLGFMTVLLIYVGALFGIPSAIGGLVSLTIIIVVVFAIWMAVMRVVN